ncbi:MAG: O-antigen ligase family protein [Acidimicrobiia bacterium]|nr:O-antigen ligase family protein [Acidimicrobiia bacterium]
MATTLFLGGAFFMILLGAAAIFGGALGIALLLARDRSLVLMVAVVASLIFPVHKLLGPFVEGTHAGAPGLVVSSTMLVLGLLYVAWMVEGTFVRDVVRAFRRPVFWTPLAAMFLACFSVGAARNDYLVLSQLVYWSFMYALFLYFGARVHTRNEIGWILLTFGAIALLEAGVVVLQKVGIIGLGLLAADAESVGRTTDIGTIGRPFGTLVHPVFLGITVATIAVVALAFALYLRRTWIRLVCVVIVLACLGQIYLAYARGPLLGVVPALVVVLAIGAAHHRVSARAWTAGIFAVLIGAIALSPQIEQFYERNFGSRHFGLEVNSRTQLNDVGWRMIEDSPLVGVGLNNFTQVMDEYTEEPLIFPGYPSHNLFILTAAETGLVGLAGLLAIGIALAWNSVALLGSRDPLFRAMGAAMLGILLLHLVAEQLSYSLRQEVPLTVFWIFAGMTMACVRIREDERRARRPVRTPRPARPPVGASAPEPVPVGV